MRFQGRTWPRVAALAAVMACALPAVAGARKGDTPPEPRKPADGAVVKDATKGLAVDFTCPAYHPGFEDLMTTANGDGYFVLLATAPDLDENGLLQLASRVDTRAAVRLELPPTPDGDPQPAHCTAELDDAGRGLLPREPGRYWWQAYRTCDTWVCTGGYEPSDVVSVSVTVTVCSVQRAAYANAKAELKAARKQLAKRRTAKRRARVARLSDRVSLLHARLRVVLRCRAS